MNTDRPTGDVVLVSAEQQDEVRAVFDKVLTILFKDMGPEKAQSLITNKEALLSVLRIVDFPLIIEKKVFHDIHNPSFNWMLSPELKEAVEIDENLPLELCVRHHKTMIAVMKVFKKERLLDINGRILSIGFNTGCSRSLLFAGLFLINMGFWIKCKKLVTPFIVSGDIFQYFLFEKIEGKFCRFRLSMETIPAGQDFEIEDTLFVGFKKAD
jgi:hypothetical protein